MKKHFYLVLILFLAIFSAHFLLVSTKFLSFSEIFNGQPIVNFDYGLHYYDVLKGTEFLNENHSFTGYDPAFMGGYFKGYIDDLSSKLWIVFVWIFQFIGVMSAYKLFIWLCLIVMPLLFFAALRVWGFSLLSATAGMAIAVLYQNTFKMGNFLWVGMITFPLAVYLSFLCSALLKRYFARGCHNVLAIFTVLAAIAFYAHILASVLIGIPALILYLMHCKKLKKRQHVYFLLSPFIIFLVNLPWLLPFFKGLHMKDFSSVTTFFQNPSFSVAVNEIFAPFLDTFHSLNIRGGLFVLGFISLWILWKKKRKAAIFIGTSFVIFSFITYSGLAFLKEIQPYRFLVVGDLFLIFACVYVVRIFEMRKLMIGLIIMVLISLQFFPSLLHTERILANDLGKDHKQLVEYFKNVNIDGRVLFEVEHSADAIFFQLETGYEMIGGPYRYMFLKNEGVNFTEKKLFGKALDGLNEEEFRDGLEVFNIKAVVCNSAKGCEAIQRFSGNPGVRFGKYEVWELT